MFLHYLIERCIVSKTVASFIVIFVWFRFLGPFQRGQRKLVMPMLNGNKVLRNYFENFERQSRRFVKCLEERVDTGEFDIMHYVGNFTLDVILGELTFAHIRLVLR